MSLLSVHLLEEIGSFSESFKNESPDMVDVFLSHLMTSFPVSLLEDLFLSSKSDS